MKTKPFIVVFPSDVNKEDVENLNGKTLSQTELDKELKSIEADCVDRTSFRCDINTYDLDSFTYGVNEQDIDVLTESWIAYVNVIEEERP